jgi:hypothetical protein
MPEARRLTIEAMLHAEDAGRSRTARICAVGVALLGARSVSIARIRDHLYSPVDASDPLGIFLDERQFGLAEGPTFRAHLLGHPVSAVRLGSRRGRHRWPVFAPIARGNGVYAAFAFPVRIRNAEGGVLTVYRHSAGPMTRIEHGDAVILAGMAEDAIVLERAAGWSTAVSAPRAESELRAAAVLVAGTAACPTIEALVRIRARALATGTPVNEVARRINAGELVLDSIDDTDDTP